MSEDVDFAAKARAELGFSRWWQIAAAALMMGLVSPYQYVWSSIEGPLSSSLSISPAAIGLVFTVFVVIQAGSQFPVGWWRDRRGPRRLTILAGLLAGGGYVGLAYATAVWQLYLLYGVGALGVGIVYTVAVNTAIKWFPDRRGLTTGAGTMAFAAGSALFVPYVRANATAAGYPDVLRNMGLLIGIGIVVGAVVLQDPPADWVENTGQNPPGREGGGERRGENADGPATDGGVLKPREYAWRETVRTWQFWLMYAMFVAGSGAGLMLTARIVSFADNHGLGATIATVSATLLPLASGVGRLVVGELSDRVARERAMAASLAVSGIGVAAVIWFARAGNRWGFVGAVVLAVFFWSPQYALFPSLVGDYYGSRNSSANYALLYSAKMWGGVFGGVVVGWLVTVAGWDFAFAVGGVAALLAGAGGLFLSPPEP
jgi:OFA family oxalate/formate antiporter-like MFS transporter